jgi:hypothetical protein
MSEHPETELQKEVKKEVALQTLREAIISVEQEGRFETLPVFVGPVGEVHRTLYATAMLYNAYRSAEEEEANGKVNKGDRTAISIRLKFEDHVKENFPDMEIEELEAMVMNYLRFVYRFSDRMLLRDENLEVTQQSVVNTMPGRDGQRVAFSTALKPSKDGKETSMRDRVRRGFRRANGIPDTFSITLLNSLMVLRVSIPTPTDLVRLINNIETRLIQYGKKYNVSAIHLERAGISQILVDFVLERLKYHSVKDVDHIDELKRYILANDINTIAGNLLCLTSPKGVSYRMYCIANKCEASKVTIIDPTAMILEVEDSMPEERRQVLYEIVNEGRKLSREELAKYAPIYTGPDGKPLDLKITTTKGTRLVIGVPSLEDYFATFNRMANRIDPELRDLAVNFPNPKVFQEKRKEYLASIRGAEYIQWFSHMEIDPEEGEEGEMEVINAKDDPEGFQEGVLDNMGDSEDLYSEALVAVIKNIPRMTYTFIGISNDTCGSCKDTAEQIDREFIPGFTPIDPIMNFFDRVRMMIGTATTEVSSVEDILS